MQTKLIIYEYSISPQKRRGLRNSCIYKVQPMQILWSFLLLFLFGFGYTFWTFWIIALYLLYKLWISNILATTITEETCIVEIRIWCKKIGTVNFILLSPNVEQFSNRKSSSSLRCFSFKQSVP